MHHPKEKLLKRLLPLFLFLPITLLGQSRQTLALDQKASSLTWTGHAEVGTYAPSGGLSVREGQILLEDGSFLGATVLIDMNSMTQSNPDLLHHLKSSDFFDVEHYPTAVIKIDHIADGSVFGTLTIKGKTTPLQSPVRITEINGHFSVAGKITLDRTQYGITYNSASFFSSLGDKAIRNSFDVEFSFTGLGEIPKKYQT